MQGGGGGDKAAAAAACNQSQSGKHASPKGDRNVEPFIPPTTSTPNSEGKERCVEVNVVLSPPVIVDLEARNEEEENGDDTEESRKRAREEVELTVPPIKRTCE